MSNIIRPEWTCGRFFIDKNSKCHALMYNLIEGAAHYFEDESAKIIGTILSFPKTSLIPLESLVSSVNGEFTNEEVSEFCNDLVEQGLLTQGELDKDKINEIRKNAGILRKQTETTIVREVQEKLPFVQEDAENTYMEIVDAEKIPFVVMLELTYNCNEKCIHCFNPGAARNDEEKATRTNREEIDINDYERLLNDLQKLGVVKIIITGGDPFVKKDIWKLISLIYERDFALDIYTNGLALVEKSEKLAKFYPRSVGLSVYSAIESIHDGITRVPGSLKKTLSVANDFMNLGIPIYFKCPIMNNNATTYYTVTELAKQYGAIPQFDVSLTDAVDGDNSISKSLQVNGEMLEVILRDPHIALYIGKEAPNYGKIERNFSNAFCGAGTSLMNITPEGDITPCNSFPTQFGNLKNKSFLDVWDNSKSLEEWQNISIKDYDECGTHERCGYCNRCPGQSFIEHGTPLKASTANCNVATLRMNLANKLKQGNDPLNGQTLEKRLQEFSITNEVIHSNKSVENFRSAPLVLKIK
jgi:radical SAM protein with 4Fe4S-binding SPASM domain